MTDDELSTLGFTAQHETHQRIDAGIPIATPPGLDDALAAAEFDVTPFDVAAEDRELPGIRLTSSANETARIAPMADAIGDLETSADGPIAIRGPVSEHALLNFDGQTFLNVAGRGAVSSPMRMWPWPGWQPWGLFRLGSFH